MNLDLVMKCSAPLAKLILISFGDLEIIMNLDWVMKCSAPLAKLILISFQFNIQRSS
jgi:hypothetical protein